MLTSYGLLAGSLLEGVSGVCLLDGKLAVLGTTGEVDEAFIVRSLISAAWTVEGRRAPLSLSGIGSTIIVAIALEKSDGSLLGFFCVQQTAQPDGSPRPQHARDTASRLQPVVDCLHRELTAATPSRAKMQILTDRTAELEWLFNLNGNLKSSADDREVVQELLRAATGRLQCAMAILLVPERRLTLEYVSRPAQGQALSCIVASLRKHLLAWAQRHQKPLLLNGSSAATRVSAQCKILSVPIIREGGRVVGVLSFFNLEEAPDFSQRHIFLARHLGRQAATFVDAQFDLMTGLQDRSLPGGYELFMRLREPDGGIVAPGDIIAAAQLISCSRPWIAGWSDARWKC